MDYFDRTVGTGDFYSLYEAEKRVNQSIIRVSSKEKLKNTLKLIAQARGVEEAREQFVRGVNVVGVGFIRGSSKVFSDYLNRLSELDINPVTIPRNWGIHRLPSLRGKLTEYFRKSNN